MWYIYVKYLKFCKKHNLKAFIPSKYAFLQSYFSLDKIELTDDIKTFKEIIKRIRDNDGYCPCAIRKIDSTKCACLACRKIQSCHCGLYKKKDLE